MLFLDEDVNTQWVYYNDTSGCPRSNPNMIDFDPTGYRPVFPDLLQEQRLNPLGPGQPNETMRSRLQAASQQAAFAHTRIHTPSMAEACLAGLWLYHDFLDESHQISQGIATPGAVTGMR